MATEKELIVARMAAVRAHLLRELIGIDEQALTTSHLYGDWTAANLLAHLGEYDGLYSQMVRDALSGQLAKTGVDYSDTRDHLLPNRVGTWSLERSVELLINARIEFVKVFSSTPDNQLKTRQRFSWKFGNKTGRSTGTINTWGQWRFMHDAGHMGDLQEWRKTLPESPLPPSTVILHAALEAARDDLWATVALIPMSDRETIPVCGAWTLKDVLGHLADWDDWYLNTFSAMIGEPTTALSWSADEADGNALNEKLVIASRKQSLKQVSDHCKAARAALITELQSISDDMLADPYGGEDSSYPSAYHCLWAALDHYLDHAAIIRRELKLKFPKYLLQFKDAYKA
ncbi:MAG: DinB family protein [Chloroflexota bacterium]